MLNTIVVAWTDTEQRPIGDYKMNQWGEIRYTFIEQRVAKACIWLDKGTEEDFEKAKKWIESEYPNNGHVFRFSRRERNPLQKPKIKS